MARKPKSSTTSAYGDSATAVADDPATATQTPTQTPPTAKQAQKEKLTPEQAKKIVAEAIKRFKKCQEAEDENRRAYKADMLFTYKPGEQWTETDKTERGKDRPMYEFNETRVKAMTVINHIRANRPQAKIRGVEESDKQMAEIRQGLYLNITNNSDFDSIKDYAAGHQVAGGMGAWRIDTEYSSDSAFDQDIVIRSIVNPMCVYGDCADKDELKRNAKYWFVHTKLPNEEYDAKYPEKDRVNFEADSDDWEDLNDDDSTWVAEYWVKKPAVKHLCLLSDGSTIDKAEQQVPEGLEVVRERRVNTHKICQYIISGNAVLEGPNEWAGSMFPFVPVYGYYVVIDGKVEWGGLTRYMKDAQRAHNWAMTSVYETIGNAPKAKIWSTPEQAKGLADQWAESNRKNLPFNLYNPDAATGGAPPVHAGGADVPVALIQAAQISSGAMNTTSGITLANEGRVSNETSGRAIRARQDEGAVATFNFGDNMAKSERRTCEIVNDLFPHIYDTQRTIRILGHDGAEKYLTINQRDPVSGEVINDMSAGKFDFTITTGPSFQTLRQEAAEFYGQMMTSNPAFAAAASDLVLKAQDYPMSDAMAERMKLMLPPPVLQAISKDKPLPPEAQAALMQAEQAMQMVAEQGQLVQQATEEAKQEKAGAEKAKADVQLAVAQLKVQEAQLQADVAKFQAQVAQAETKLVAKGAGQDQQAEKAELSTQLSQALANIQSEAAQLFRQYTQQLAAMHAQAMQTAQPQIVVANQPRKRVVRAAKINGQWIGEIDEQPIEQAGPGGSVNPGVPPAGMDAPA